MEQHVYDDIHSGGANHLHEGHSMAMMHYDQTTTSNLTSSSGGDYLAEEMPAMMMMKMYFHFGLGDMVLFKSLVVDSQVKMWATCFVLFLCAILLEAIDYSRGYLSCRCREEATQQRASRQTSDAHLIEGEQNNGQTQTQMSVTSTREWSCCSGSNANANTTNHQESPKFFPVRTSDPPLMRLVQSVLQVIRTALALGLMLVVMTYNLCLIFPILLGSGVGFFLFYRPVTLDSKGAICH